MTMFERPDNSLRLYYDLAWLWPLWEHPDDYSDECEQAAQLIRRYAVGEVRTALNLGCGGGKNAYNLKRHFQITGLDLAEPMLANARALNPDCEFVKGDMTSFDLSRLFDCVLVDDAIAYMTTPAALAAVFAGAWSHLRQGGAMIVRPEHLKESFTNDTTRISHLAPRLKPDNLDVTFIENEYDPDPDDDTYEFTLVYLIRESGRLRVEHDGDVSGLFSIEAWRAALREAGFEVHEESSAEPNARAGTPVFVCVKPIGPSEGAR